MIRTLSDFLEELKAKGTELIKKYEIIDHPVLIGDMYEGLTQELLNRAIFDGLNLKIVGGKIKNSKGDLSSEIDCMLVEGEGETLPFTEKFIYHFSQVIAVIEVKKSLYTNTLSDSYFNLRTVIDVSIEPEKDGEEYIIRSLRDAWKSMLRIDLPRRSELDSYSISEQHIYHTLLMEAYFPLRIVFGYFGFKTEYSLREAFANYLGNQANFQPAKGFGAGSLPNLIICGKNSIIKNNGMPYAMPFMDEKFYWPILVTSRENPIHHLLEIISTRLSYKYGISSSIFGDDFDYDPVHRYINCKLGNTNEGNLGWEYSYSPFSEKLLSESKHEKIPWSPKFLTKKQFIVLMQLGTHEFINYKENLEFIESIKEEGTDINDFIKSLVDTGLVYDRNNEIRFLTDECRTVILPDGRYCAGENKNGELSNWLSKFITGNKS
jgi:hypothetical protein